MDPLCKSILLDYIKSDKLIFLFEICGVIKINDIMEINDDTLNKMEKYIYNFLSHEKNVDQYLDPLFIYKSPEFLFSPGLRMKILRAVKRIKEENALRRCDIRSVDEETTEIKNQSNDKSNTDLTVNKQKIEVICKENDRNTEQNNIDITKKNEILNTWAQNVIERVSKKFTDVKLQYTEDFDLDVKILKTENGPKWSGLFMCHLCRKLKGQTKSIKFSVSKENYVILSNVITHLKLHFAPIDKLVCLPTQLN